MITIGRAFALAALITMGAGTVEMTRSLAAAVTITPAEAHAAARVDTAFDLVAAMPPTAPFMFPMARKGDLLVSAGCAGLTTNANGRSTGVPSAPSTLVEYRGARSSTLLRLAPITIAVVND